jgi:hypothetical protein
MTINRYSRRFIAACPNKDEQIIYDLVIDKATPIMVEHIVAATQMIRQGYHEAIADALHRQFGGRQVLRAHHQGVDIETVRESA